MQHNVDDDGERGYSYLHPPHPQLLQDPNDCNFHSDAAYFEDDAFGVAAHVVAECGIDLNDAVDNTVAVVFPPFEMLMQFLWKHEDFLQDVLMKKDDERRLHAVDCLVPWFVAEELDLAVVKEFL